MSQQVVNASLISKVTVLYGGDSAEREVSLHSGEAIAKGLAVAGFQVTLIDTKGFCLSDLTKEKPDIVFIALHGRGGEDGCVQGALEYMNIPYTGSNVLGSALSMDKIRSKQIMQALGLPTAKFAVVSVEDYLLEEGHLGALQMKKAKEILTSLGGKVMVKPANEGSSIGMAMAESSEQLDDALKQAFVFDREVLVEAWINGPEYTVSILGTEAMPAIHMETPRDFYDYEAKYQSNSTQYHCPCGLAESEESKLKALSLRAFKATGASGWGRVDVMRDSSNQWQILEVNTVPGMTETSLVPKAAKVFGLNFSQLVTRIVELAMEKNNKKDMAEVNNK